MREKWDVRLALGLALFLAGIVVGCERATPTPSPASDISEIRQICADQSERGRALQAEKPEGYEYPPFEGLIYVEGQVVLAGPLGEISALIDTLDLELELMDSIDLDEQKEGEPVVVQLYQIANGEWVEQVVCEINRLSAETGASVSADPNYHMSPAGGWTGGGSPWTQNGVWTEGLDGGGIAEAASGDFLTQWALGPLGIGLFDAMGNRRVEQTGDGVRIGIFDTSPFEVADGDSARFPFQQLMGDVPDQQAADGVQLIVWHPVPLPAAPTCPGPDRFTGQSREGQNVSSHGLFVAGLAHVVAPSSEIYLVRVLENDACGALFTINKAIKMFVDQTLKDRGGALESTVINLSLGIHEPSTPTAYGLPSEAKSLQTILQRAVDQGAVVVAATGNDSFDSPPEPVRPMENPAGYEFVVGVAASNFNGGRGCFSNEGDVAAPGGNGEPTCDIPKCEQGNFSACLVSLVWHGETNYAYWVGTSFATPLVSGQAALLLDAGTPAADVRGKIAGNAVKTRAYEAPLGDGIINIPASLP